MAEQQKENEEGQEQEAQAEAPASSKKLYIIIGVVALLVLAAGIPAYFMLKGGEKSDSELDSQAALTGDHLQQEGFDDEDELYDDEEPLGALFPLETFVVNLQDGGFIRLQVQLEFNGRSITRRFYTRIVPIRDRIISLLASKSQKELSNNKEKDKLRNDIKEIVNEIMRKQEVKKVYFSQFIMQ